MTCDLRYTQVRSGVSNWEAGRPGVNMEGGKLECQGQAHQEKRKLGPGGKIIRQEALRPRLAVIF